MSHAEKTSRPRPIIVLGAERSGTSVVAEMICKWGAYPGESGKLRKADEHNRQGYWEYTPIWDFLVEMGVNWWDVGFQEQLRGKVSIPKYKEKALKLIAGMEKEGKPWVWKDPALSFFLPFWKEIWGDATYIITVRNPYDTALSWQKFVMSPNLQGTVSLTAGNMLRWHYIMLLIFVHAEDTERKIFIPYEGLMREPGQQAKRLYEFLEQQCEVKVSDEARIGAMAQVVNPELWHNDSRISFGEVNEATDELKALYEFAERKTRNPSEKFEIAKYPMYAGWREFVKNGETLARFQKGKLEIPAE